MCFRERAEHLFRLYNLRLPGSIRALQSFRCQRTDRNTIGKSIVGLVFNAALADATEHWIWLHWDFDVNRPIRDFGWNKLIKPDVAKTLSWDRANIDFEHGGGGAFVLTSALFSDGPVWQEIQDGASCKYVWFNRHKKSMVKPVQLPYRE